MVGLVSVLGAGAGAGGVGGLKDEVEAASDGEREFISVSISFSSLSRF